MTTRLRGTAGGRRRARRVRRRQRHVPPASGPRLTAALAVLCLTLSVASAPSAAAQSPRATALGGAFWTAGGEGHAIFHHPALISGEGFAISFGGMHGEGARVRDVPDHDHGDQGLVRPGAVGFGRGSDDGHDHDHHDHDGRDRDGLRGLRDIALSASGSWFGGTAAAGVTELEGGYLAALGFARELFGVDAGVAAKVMDGGEGTHAALFDLGIARGLGPIAAALTVQNLGRHARGGGAAACDEHARRCWTNSRVVLGAATNRRPLGPLDVGGALQVAVEGNGTVVPGGGVEVAWWPLQRRVFIARAGLTRALGGGSPLTFGAGFAGDRIRIDYGYGELGYGLAPHRIGVAIR